MLINSSRLTKTPIMSLQTGTQLGVIDQPIINPADLQIIAYRVASSLTKSSETYLRIIDSRELSDIGLIIDSIDDFVVRGDVIKLDELCDLNFKLDKISVIDEKRKKLGKVIDYTIDVDDFRVQQLIVRRPLMKSFNDTELVIHRSQIIEITNSAIVVHSEAKAPEHTRITTPGSYVNPFRKSKPAAESIDLAN